MTYDNPNILEEEQLLPKIDREYQDYLNRLESDYLKTCSVFAIIQDMLLTITANSANISMCLLCLSLGLGVISSAGTGFVFGSIPGIISIKNSKINIADGSVADVSRLVFGGMKFIMATGVSYNAVKEYKQLMDYASFSIKNFEIEVKNYEIKVQPTDNLFLIFHFQFVLGASCLLALIPVLWKILRRY